MRFASNFFNPPVMEVELIHLPAISSNSRSCRFSMLGLGSRPWTSWKMQQILIDSHKQNVLDIAASAFHRI